MSRRKFMNLQDGEAFAFQDVWGLHVCIKTGTLDYIDEEGRRHRADRDLRSRFVRVVQTPEGRAQEAQTTITLAIPRLLTVEQCDDLILALRFQKKRILGLPWSADPGGDAA